MNKKLKVLIVLSLVVVLGGSIAIYLVRKSNNSSLSNSLSKNDKPNQNPPEIPKNNPKKTLFNQIKTDLNADFAKLKSGHVQHPKHWTDYILYGQDTISCWIKGRKHLIKKDKLEPNDWNEITQEIKRLSKVKKEKFQVKEAEMATNPELFIFENKIEKVLFLENSSSFYNFVGKTNNKEYYLLIPTDCSILNNINLNENNWDKKRSIFYKITGTFKNIPLEYPPSGAGKMPYKLVKPTDKITIQQC